MLYPTELQPPCKTPVHGTSATRRRHGFVFGPNDLMDPTVHREGAKRQRSLGRTGHKRKMFVERRFR